ncbi:MAG: hypothetical protein DHS20C05_17770 [Hyphococcus sp.]|nr:MAG: hypothetical protein DHS20C05_17770 [Marinicaulis sp.]
MTLRNIITASIAASFIALSANASDAAPEDSTTMEQAGSEILYSGEWTKKSFKSSGTWEIYSEDGKTLVKLSDDFRTRKAPDLKIFLSPLEASLTTGKNATEGSLLVAALSSNKGGQVYELPENTDLTAYKSILIHCEAYSKLWSAANL